MPMMKQTLGIAFAAGVLAAGAQTVLPSRNHDAARPSTTHEPAPPSVVDGEMAAARNRLRDAMAAAHAKEREQTAAAQSPPPGQRPSPAPAPGPVAEAQALATALSPPTTASIPQATMPAALPDAPAAAPSTGEATGAAPTAQPKAWVSIPRPELIAKADALLDNGDVAGARLWFEIALEQGDADAAFRLAETYDPEMLAKWRIVGIVSDPAKARALYERAWNGGVEAAQPRVARLGR